MTVLRYIQNTTSRYKTFVANRIAIIHDLTDVEQWHFIEGKINPADLALRGFMPSKNDKFTTWLTGPSFLQTSKYPETCLPEPQLLPDLEHANHVMITAQTTHFVDSIVERCGNWSKIKETTRQVLQFINLIAKRPVTTLSVESIILKRTQEASFNDDYLQLKNDKQISAASKLAQLNSFLDTEGVIRLRGRISSSKLQPEMKTPILLPRNHRVTKLIIRNTHEKNGHVGLKQVISSLRQRYWILQCTTAVKSVLGQCIFCRRAHRPLMHQKMAPLPDDRLTPGEPPFTRVGIDFLGHFTQKLGVQLPSATV